ncbi:hypothetical protein FACS1894109_00380 [Spirochaetia bacterium]|nr:hypothetical protein FACS1894109_00380 [Spirochaetia bacterium]
MTIEQTVEIPASHRLTIDVPREIPVGRMQVIIRFPDPAEAAEPCPKDGCSLCAIYKEPNEKTIAAFEEGEAMMRGEIPSPTFHSLEEVLAELRS